MIKRIYGVLTQTRFSDKFSFIKDIIKGYFLNGTEGLLFQLSEWEESVEISSNEKIMHKINQIKKQL